MVYAYIRVSTKLQDQDKQKYELYDFAHAKKLMIDSIIEEVVSSRKSYRNRKLGELIENASEKDIILVTELSRLGRSIMEVMEILNQLMVKKVKLLISKNDMTIEENFQSKVMAFAFSLAADIERELISSRTREALKKVKAEGKTLGRPKGSLSKSKLDEKEQVIDLYLSKKISITSICKLLEVSPATFYNFCRNRSIDLNRYKLKDYSEKVPIIYRA